MLMEKSKQPKKKLLFFFGTVPQFGVYNCNRTNRKESNEDDKDQMEEQRRETEHQPRAFPQDVKGRSLVTSSHRQTHSFVAVTLINKKKSCIGLLSICSKRISLLLLPLMWSCDLCIVFSLRTFQVID